MKGVLSATLPATLALGCAVASAASAPVVRTTAGCYPVGKTVHLIGSGFAPDRAYDVAIDGVDFGQDTTDASGSFHTHLIPGGLGAGVVQSVDRLDVTDGTSDARAVFTVSRSAGARFEATRGDPRTLRAPFQVWGFNLQGAPGEAIYLHYVSPAGQARDTVHLGRAGGQCGYLVTKPLRFFPFSPLTGAWTLQVDTWPRYSRRPSGPVARISVQIARG